MGPGQRLGRVEQAGGLVVPAGEGALGAALAGPQGMGDLKHLLEHLEADAQGRHREAQAAALLLIPGRTHAQPGPTRHVLAEPGSDEGGPHRLRGDERRRRRDRRVPQRRHPRGEVRGEHRLTGLLLENHVSGERIEFAAEALFIAIGHDPNTAIFEGQLELEASGYVVSRDGVHTSVPGVFVAGDVYDIRYKQAITAAGMGCRASLEAERYLEELDAERAAGGLAVAAT